MSWRTVTSFLYLLTCLVNARASKEAALEYSAKHAAEYNQDLAKLVSFPTISALGKAHAADFTKAVAWLIARAKKAGLEHVQELATPVGQPSVYADWLHAGKDAPTILIYAHYDVQPVTPLDAWTSPPFSPVVKDGHLYGRGASDCKAGTMQTLHSLECVLKSSKALPVNVKILLEGQEEIGSPNLPDILTKHKDLLSADFMLCGDGGQISKTQPSIPLGFRGSVGLEVVLQTLNRDVHSGLYGGSVDNAPLALARLLSTLHTPDGAIAVEGYYDDVRPMSSEDKKDAEAYGWDQEAQHGELGVRKPRGEPGFTPLEHTWHRPSLDVIGLVSGHTGDGIKTILPARAIAKLSSRIVPNMDPQKTLHALKTHLIKHAPPTANISFVDVEFSAAAYDCPRESLGNRVAAKVLAKLLGNEARYERSGGTIPALALFKELLGIDTTVFGFGLPEDHIHAPDERYSLEFFATGRNAFIEFLFGLADNKGQAAPSQADKDEL